MVPAVSLEFESREPGKFVHRRLSLHPIPFFFQTLKCDVGRMVPKRRRIGVRRVCVEAGSGSSLQDLADYVLGQLTHLIRISSREDIDGVVAAAKVVTHTPKDCPDFNELLL